jgi:putative transposase
MARPLRLEFAGAHYHLSARGDRREPIFVDDEDRLRFLELLAKEVSQQGWLLYAYCLMGNHYHLLLETPRVELGSRNAQTQRGLHPSLQPPPPLSWTLVPRALQRLESFIQASLLLAG